MVPSIPPFRGPEFTVFDATGLLAGHLGDAATLLVPVIDALEAVGQDSHVIAFPQV